MPRASASRPAMMPTRSSGIRTSKAEAIDQLAREQAIAQARKMVNPPPMKHGRSRTPTGCGCRTSRAALPRWKKTRGEMMDYLAKMIEELQKTQDYASQSAPLVPHTEDLAEADAEPKLDLSANKVDAAASALRGSEPEPQPAPADPDTNRVVAPALTMPSRGRTLSSRRHRIILIPTPRNSPATRMRRSRSPVRSSPTRSCASRGADSGRGNPAPAGAPQAGNAQLYAGG